ncbi:MAG: AraC family transcriptional regulator [Brachymonas sp.]|nr:AraC family transcriptional regulator [Brachymonas sp.]
MLKTAAQMQALLRSAPGGLTLAQRLQVEGLALTLLGQWLELPLQAPCAQKLRRYRAVDDVIDIIRAELSEDLGISELARRVGANECYLKHDFRERTGMGIAAFVRQQRMTKALGLLEEGQSSVRQVAHEVGYQSLGHFARAFRAAHGMLPSELQGKRLDADGENARKM